MGADKQYREADPSSVQRAQEGSQQQLRVPVCARHSPFPHVCINNLAKEGVLISFADSLTSAGVRALLTLGACDFTTCDELCVLQRTWHCVRVSHWVGSHLDKGGAC